MNEPKLRFKADDGSQFPDWEEHNFGDLYKVCSGYAFKYENYCASGVALVNGQAIQHGWIDDNNMNYLPETFLQQYKDFVLKENDIVLGLNRPITNGKLKIARVPKEYNNSLLYQRAGKIVCKKAADDDFSYALLAREIFKFTIKEAAGSDQPFISTSKLNNWKIIVPGSDKEQQKIAEFLSTVDTVIEKQKETVLAWEERKKGVMQKLFSQEVRFKADDGSNFPEWEKKKIGDVFDVTRGYVLPVKKTREVSDNEYKYPVYSSQTKNNGLMGFYNQKLYENAITWTTDGANAGKTVYRGEEFYCTNVCGVLLDKNGNHNANDCIANMIDTISKKYVSYVGNPKLMNNVMSEIEIDFPCLEEQQKIADCLSSLDEVIEKQKATLAAWEELKKGLLQQMFV